MMIKDLISDKIYRPIYYSSVLKCEPEPLCGMFANSRINYYQHINEVPIPKKWYENDTSNYKDNRWGRTTLKITEKKFNEKLIKELYKRQRLK
tara:strand:+ start:472 stop:750 length:279 start_codon:yes stop_codon:yes gene_type:complete